MRRRPDDDNQIYHMDKDPNIVNPRMEKVANALFNQKFKPIKVEKQKKERATSAKSNRNKELKQVTEEEYIKTLYPDINYGMIDEHCTRSHYKEWFGEFLQKLYEKSNQMKYDIFMQRCVKTSPYNDNGGQNFAMLKRLAKEKAQHVNKSYEANTISFLAKRI